jgi:hypothetical protein
MRPGSRLGSAQDNYFENNLVYAGTYNSWIYNFVKSSTSYPVVPGPAGDTQLESLLFHRVADQCHGVFSEYGAEYVAAHSTRGIRSRRSVVPYHPSGRKNEGCELPKRNLGSDHGDSGIESKVCGGLPQGRGTTNSKKLLN